jgi:hypothetical protein
MSGPSYRRYNSVLEKFRQKEPKDDVFKDLQLDREKIIKEINPHHRKLSSIPSFDQLLAYEGPEISCIYDNNEQIIEDLNESDVEVSEQIEKSILKSLSKEDSSYNKSFTNNFNSNMCSTPEDKTSLESNYLTFGLAKRGRRTNDSSYRITKSEEVPNNYSTNDCSTK